jgi:metal-dependent amidase/aminoacylase/carboxypeptidase family protein
VPESSIQVSAKTGLIVTLQGTAEAKGSSLTIALRSDHDALPIDELNKKLPYVSKTKAAHMCGHDGHTTMMLGGVALISANLDKIPSDRTVKIFF